MGNEKMGKWKQGTLSAKLMFCVKNAHPCMNSLRDHSWHQKGMQQHCIIVCKLVLCNMFFTSGSLLAFLKFIESVSYFVPTLYKELFFFMQLIVLDIHIIFVSTIQAASIVDKLITTVCYHPYAILYLYQP